MDDLFSIVAGTIAHDRQVNNSVQKGAQKLTFQRDENGILWSIDAKTGEKVGHIYEHGDDSNTDTIKEI